MLSAARKRANDGQTALAEMTAEIGRLNADLTCLSEASHALSTENARLHEALASALAGLEQNGQSSLAQSISDTLSGNSYVALPTAG